MIPTLKSLALVSGLSKLDVTLIIALVPTAILAVIDIGLISIIRWLVRGR